MGDLEQIHGISCWCIQYKSGQLMNHQRVHISLQEHQHGGQSNENSRPSVFDVSDGYHKAHETALVFVSSDSEVGETTNFSHLEETAIVDDEDSDGVWFWNDPGR